MGFYLNKIFLISFIKTMISKIPTSFLLLFIATTCRGAPFVFKSRKEASDWFTQQFISHVKIMAEDKAANQNTCKYGSYWNGEECESCQPICVDLHSSLCTKACPVYAAVTSATLNFEKFSERFVTKEEANYYKMLLYILCGLVGVIYIMILCKLLVCL